MNNKILIVIIIFLFLGIGGMVWVLFISPKEIPVVQDIEIIPQEPQEVKVVSDIVAGGTLWAWGANEYGKLGLGDTDNRYTPTQVGIDTDWKKVITGPIHNVAIKEKKN